MKKGGSSDLDPGIDGLGAFDGAGLLPTLAGWRGHQASRICPGERCLMVAVAGSVGVSTNPCSYCYDRTGCPSASKDIGAVGILFVGRPRSCCRRRPASGCPPDTP